jgi:putative ABC transport system permease protein
MDGVKDISYFELSISYILMIIPIAIFGYYKTGLVRSTIISVLRMTIQLLLVGIYLEYIFKLNYWWLNFLWALIMLLTASISITNSTSVSFKIFFIPVFMGVLLSIVFIDAFFFGLIIKLDNFFDAIYFIPITGMLLGNTMNNNIIAINNYYSRLKKEQNLYRFLLANGATRSEALTPFMKETLKISFNPTIANTATIGLVSLPGMMTGQILGGSTPNIAIKYQILIILTIFVAQMITVFLTIVIANLYVFDEFDNFKTDIVEMKK